MALLALVLGHSLRRVIVARSLERGREEAQFVTNVGLGAYLDPEDLDGPLTHTRERVLDLVVRASGPLEALRIWGRSGVLVYASDRGERPMPTRPPADVRSAFAGSVGSGVLELDGTKVLMLDVPLRFGGGEPAGAMEVAVSYDYTARQIAHDTHVLYMIMLGGLGFLYAALFRIVASASRQLRRQAAENERLALHDALTGLPNRAHFEKRVRAALGDRRGRSRAIGLMLIDLDEFKSVNDTYGHAAGDLLLRTVAERVRDAVRSADTVARLGGDEIAVVTVGLEELLDAEEVAGRIVAAIAPPVGLPHTTLVATASVGIAWCASGEAAFEGLLETADRAMYLAKQAGGGRYQVLSLPPRVAAA